MAENKRWEDEQSMEGLGYLQGICRVPYEISKTKGELMLSYQNRIAEAVEKMSAGTEPQTIVEVIESGESEAMEGLSEQVDMVLQEMEGAWGQREEELAELREINEMQRYIHEGIQDVSSGVKTGNALQTVTAGLNIAQLIEQKATGAVIKRELPRINENLLEILDLEEAQNEWLEEIDGGLHDLNRTAVNILQDGNQRTRILSELLKLVKDKMRQDAIRHEDMKRRFFALFGLVIRRIAGFNKEVTRGFRQLIEGQRHAAVQRDEMIGRLGSQEELKAAHYRKTGLAWLGDGKYEEALTDLQKAAAANSRDFKVRLGLAQAYRCNGHLREYGKEFSLAVTLAGSKEEYVLILEEALTMMYVTGNVDADLVAALVQLVPSRFTEVMDFVRKNGNTGEILENLRGKSVNNFTVTIGCAVEYARLGNKETTEKIMQELADLCSGFNPAEFESMGISAGMPELAPYASALDAGEVVSGDFALLMAAAVLDGGNDAVTVYYLEKACMAPGYLKSLIPAEKYEQAYDVLKAVFGRRTASLTKFGVLPKQLRFLIHEKS